MKKIYNLKHNFSKYNENVSLYLNNLYRNSLNLYNNTFSNNNTGTTDLDLITIRKTIGYIEDYLFYYYTNYPSKYVNIHNTIVRNIKKVNVFDRSMRGLYGQYIPFESSLLINPEITGSKHLTKDERTRLYVCHELGHAVNDEWLKTFNNYVHCPNNKIKNMTYQGFSLLDEAITQNMAENIAYSYAKKSRPKFCLYRGSLYSGEFYKSNFDFYGNLQEPAILFSKTLRGIGCLNDDYLALDKLSVRALDKDFLKDIVEEYKRDRHETDFFYIMPYLGIIKRASYATFGCDDIKYIDSSLSALNELKLMAVPLRDYRPQFVR